MSSFLWGISWRSVFFVWSAAFRELGDERLVQIGRRLKLVQILIVSGLIALVALFATHPE